MPGRLQSVIRAYRYFSDVADWKIHRTSNEALRMSYLVQRLGFRDFRPWLASSTIVA
jgi:hypothetical protein